MAKKSAKQLTGMVTKPTLYRPEYCTEIIEFFTVEPYREVERVHEKSGQTYWAREANDLPTLAQFAAHIKVSRRVLGYWAQAHPEFAEAVARAKELAEHHLVTNALHGLYNPNFATFVAKNYSDMRDTKHVVEDKLDAEPKTPAEILKEIDRLDVKIRELEAQL